MGRRPKSAVPENEQLSNELVWDSVPMTQNALDLESARVSRHKLYYDTWDFTDFSKEALKTRAEFLINVIDKIPDKATSADIEALPEGRVVVNWGPSSGKTTAIRQWFCKNPLHYSIFATARMEDVDSMYYDLMAMKAYGAIDSHCLIEKYTADHDPGETRLRLANIVVCTHERLMIEPPYLLYTVTGDLAGIGNQILRDTIFIDEMPKFYKEFVITPQMMTYLGWINQNADDSGLTRIDRARYRYSKCEELVRTYISHPDQLDLMEYGIISGFIDELKKSNIRFKFNRKRRTAQKLSYFVDYLAEQVQHLSDTGTESSVLLYSKVYYSLLDIEVPNIYIFDGTGDLILGGSDSWTMHRDFKFARELILNHEPEVLEGTDMPRNIKSAPEFDYAKSCIESLASHIKKLLDSDPNRKVLVYTWKSIRLQFNYYIENPSEDNWYGYFPNYLRSMLTPEENRRVRIMHYNSGKEKVTSEYSDCDTIIIAGKFFIPNSAVACYNLVNHTRISSLDYTASLIIQAIYRTSARHRKPINLYFTDDYSKDIIDFIMSKFDSVKLNNTTFGVMAEDITGYHKLVSTIKYTSRNEKYFEFIKPYLNDLYQNGEVVLSVPPNTSRFCASYTRDYKLSIQKLLKNSDITYENIYGTTQFKLIYQRVKSAS